MSLAVFEAQMASNVNTKRQKNRETNLVGVALNPSGPYVWWALYIIKLSELDLMIDQVTLLFSFLTVS